MVVQKCNRPPGEQYYDERYGDVYKNIFVSGIDNMLNCIAINASAGDDTVYAMVSKDTDNKIGILRNDMNKKIFDLDIKLSTEINGIANYIANQVLTEITNRINADEQLKTNIINLGNQLRAEQNYARQQDRSWVSSQISDVTNYVNTSASVIWNHFTGQVNDVKSTISDVKSALGKIIDDPLGWIVKVFKVIFLPFLTEEVGYSIAPDTDKLPPRSDYVKMLYDEDLI